MGKKVTSVSIDEELSKRLKHDEHVNASGLFNQFLKEYYSTGSADGLDFRLIQVEQEIEKKCDELERLKKERDRLREAKEQREEERDPELDQTVEQLRSIPEGKLGPKNPAVVQQAQNLGMSPQQLMNKIRAD